MPDVNMIAVLVAVVTNTIIGTLWYGPLFGKKWMTLVGLSDEDVKKGAAVPMVAAVVGAALTAFIFGVISAKLGVDSMRGYLETAFWMWLGFTAIPSFVNTAFSGKSKELWAIESFNWFATMMTMAVVFGAITL